MNDHEIDKLLEDSDAALAVQPSPTVAARVRTRIAESSTRGATWRRALASAGVISALVVATYAGWRNPTSVQEPTAFVLEGTSGRLPPVSEAVQQSKTRPPEAQGGRTAKRAASNGVIRREPEVLVALDARIAFEEFRAAAGAGRLTATAFSTEHVEIEPTVVVPSVVELPPLDLGVAPVEPAMSAPVPPSQPAAAACFP